MRKSLLFVGLFSFLLSNPSFARNPQGQFANYKLDRSQARTSSIMQKGLVKLEVGTFKPTPGGDGTTGKYVTKVTYDIKALFAGHMKGTKIFDVPSDIFDPELIERVRNEGEIDAVIFKMKHLGIEDVRTGSGVTYPSCDKVLIYDMKLDKIPSLGTFILETFRKAHSPDDERFKNLKLADVKNLKVIFYVTSSLPVIGAAKMDGSAKISGFDIKVGFDYVPPTSSDSEPRKEP